jgi:hypothetical protein
MKPRLPAIAIGAIVLLATSPALASCPSLPDGPDSANVRNGTARAVCLQTELSAESQRIQQQAQLRGMMEDLQRQQMEIRQLSLPPLPNPAF